MARRESESAAVKPGDPFIPRIPQIRVSTDLIFKVPEVFYVTDTDGKPVLDANDQKIPIDMGKNWVRYEYEAHVNQPEIVRVTVLDPHHTIFDEHLGNYFTQAIPHPLFMMTQGRWSPVPGGRKLELTKKVHAIMSIKSIGPGEQTGADQSYLTFTGISIPHYMLAAGDAGGYVYEGRISDIISQVCKKYSRGLFDCIVRSQTKDDQHNKWWQNRMYPLAFIKSLLRWSTSLTRMKTRWIFCADTDLNLKAKQKLEFFEQRDDSSKHRSTYWWGADPSKLGHGDILNYEMMGDSGRDLWRGKIVTSGISTLSGAYHDRIVHWPVKDVVYVDEARTGNKYVQLVKQPKEAYTQPSTDEPLKEAIGWTRAHSLPELAAGEMGLKYEDYIDGYARGEYYRDTVHLQRVAFTILGHHIWSESIGLGYDTINIMWRTPKHNPHHMHGVWIVDGFKHVLSTKGWETTLYCHRLYFNAQGKRVGHTQVFPGA